MHQPNFLRAGLSFLSAVLALAVTACGGSSDNGATDSGTGPTGGDSSLSPDGTTSGSTPLPCDINAIVVPHCQGCHSNPPQSGAPMPLVTWEDFHATTPVDALGPQPVTGTYVYQTVQYRIADDQAPMPQPPNPRLDAADLATMNAWLTSGAPQTDGATCAADGGVTLPDGGPPTLSCPSGDSPATIAPASAWTVPMGDPTDYICYTATIPAMGSGNNHVIGITPNIVNHKVVHHVLLFQADPADTSVTSTPAPCPNGGGSSLSWRMVYGWAPGGGSLQTPPNVGFPFDSTTQWIVQVHYSNPDALSGETDTSGFSFCTTDQPVQYDADVVAFGSMNFTIPADGTLDISCQYTIPSLLTGIHTFAAFPHMHILGTAIQTEQTFASGPGIVGMAENIPWNFNNQLQFPIDAVLNQGDTVTTRCAWQNSGDAPVSFGQDTTDEMCYSFTSYYPKVESTTWTWALPALTSTCQTSAPGGLPTPDAGWSTGPGIGSGSADAGEDGAADAGADAGDGG